MAFDTEKKEDIETKEKKKVLTSSRIKYVVIAVILLLVAATFFGLALWTADGLEEDQSYVETADTYSASRFFCRMKHPEDWAITSDDNGFYLDKETGLIFQSYPYTTQEVVLELEVGATEPPTTPEPLKVPIENVLVSVFYQPSPEFAWPESSPLPEGVTPSPTPKVTPKPTPTFAPYPLERAGVNAVELMKTKILSKQASEGGPDYSFSQGIKYEGKNCSYLEYQYQYTSQNGLLMKGKMYVCSRAMAYYVITYEATEDLYTSYEGDFKNIIDNFTFSVFDY